MSHPTLSSTVPTAKPLRLLRQPTVLERVCLSRTEWYRRVKAGKAPAPVRLGANSIAWRESDIDAFIADLRPANLPNADQTPA